MRKTQAALTQGLFGLLWSLPAFGVTASPSPAPAIKVYSATTTSQLGTVQLAPLTTTFFLGVKCSVDVSGGKAAGTVRVQYDSTQYPTQTNLSPLAAGTSINVSYVDWATGNTIRSAVKTSQQISKTSGAHVINAPQLTSPAVKSACCQSSTSSGEAGKGCTPQLSPPGPATYAVVSAKRDGTSVALTVKNTSAAGYDLSWVSVSGTFEAVCPGESSKPDGTFSGSVGKILPGQTGVVVISADGPIRTLVPYKELKITAGPIPAGTHALPCPTLSPLELGRSLYQTKQCAFCHDTNGVVAPVILKGFGTTRRFLVGTTVQTGTMNETYIRESIRNPAAKLAVKADNSKFPGAMTTFGTDSLSDADINAIIEYLK